MHPYLEAPRPHLFGHRGASGEAPENTLPAFERAAAAVPFLEMDCHATRDGEIVICHDARLERTTDGSGPISGHDFAELARLDAGHRFTPDGGRTFPFRGAGVRIPRLVEVLEAFPDHRINLEVKQAEPPIAAEVLRLVRRAGAEPRVLLAAADDPVMEQIRKLDPGTALGASTGEVLEFYRAVATGTVDAFRPGCHALQIPPAFGGNPLVTPESVDAARRLGLCIHVWTVNDPGQMRELLALGVDGLMSDYPRRLVETARGS